MNYRRLVEEGKLKEIAGFSDFYKWLKKIFTPSIPIVIASNGHSSSIETSLKAIGYFDSIKYYSTEQGSVKISKEHLLRSVVKDLQVRPQNCLVLEDSSLGANAAKKIGMMVTILNTSQLPEENFDADLIVNNYLDPELYSFVKEIYDDREVI